MPRSYVIVVDDDPLFRSLLTSMLRKDYAVSVAADGAEGYYKALERPPQLAIIDIQMAGWDGLRTLKAFRTNYLLSRVPIMIMTSDASRQTVMAALEGGANDFVIKTTLTREEFLAKVTDLIESAVHASDGAEGQPAITDAEIGDAAARVAGSLSTEPLSEEAFLQSIVENWD